MTEQEFLNLAKAKYQELKGLQKEKSFYEYEKKFDELWVEFGRQTLEKNISSTSKDRRKKNHKTRYGTIGISKTHVWSEQVNGFRVSPYLQELQLYAGQEDNFKMAAESLTKYLRVEMSSSHIDRIVKYYGETLEDESGLAFTAFETAKEEKQHLSEATKVYTMIDGCMLLTRKKGAWKEMKLGRIFNSDVHYELSSTRNWIKKSTYTAHFGGHQVFLDKIEYWLDEYLPLNERLVFVNDGAKWIWNWVEDNYPLATQILDFFHAMEYLSEFAKVYFKNKSTRKDWLKEQKTKLLNDEVEKVIEVVAELNCTSKNQQEAQKKLITYYENNKCRIQYKAYKTKGLLIGSDPIESAHRTVIQKRLKQSGQRWTKTGAQAVANLRIANMSDNWNQVTDLINTVAA